MTFANPTGKRLWPTLGDVVRTYGADKPAAPALSFDGQCTTWGELHARSSRMANALAARGVGAGDRVAILAHNAPVFFELAFAVAKLNATLAGLNWRLAAPEIEVILDDAEPQVLLVEDALLDRLTAAAKDRLATAAVSLGTLAAEVALCPDTDPQTACAADDVVFLLYTSGTTGVPKGVQLTHRNMAHSAWIAEHAYAMQAGLVNLVAMPLFHVGGMGYGMSAFLLGGHTVLLPDPDPARVVAAMAAFRVTHAFFVPAVVQAIVALDGIDDAEVSSLERLVYGAAPISDALLRRALAVFGCQFVQAYGMTETAGTVVALPPEDHDPDGAFPGRLRSCGKALPWVELRVVDPSAQASSTQASSAQASSVQASSAQASSVQASSAQASSTQAPSAGSNAAAGGDAVAGRDVAVGVVGEIWTRSAQNTPGYRNKPEETTRTITADGWLRTGDAAYMDEDGYVFLFDRFKDMIVSGAENVYPAEVENVLYDHPGVAEVAVIGVPDERWGEAVKAIVVAVADPAPSAETLIEFARTRLARYKCPKSVDFVDALPRNASGKVLKVALREPYWRGRKRQIA